MNRREFLSLGAVAGVAAAAGCVTADARTSASPRTASPKPSTALMKLGCQRFGAKDDCLQFYARYGVGYIAAGPDGPWTAENIRKTRERAQAYGIDIVATHIPPGNVLLEQGELRDKTIAQFCETVRIGGGGGYSALFYGLNIPVGVPSRTDPTPGRGKVSYSTFEFATVPPGPPIAEPVPAAAMWERITYFLERVVPVAEKCKVRLACHPQDPPLPEGYRGAGHVLSTVEGLKRFVSIADSDYHGLHFCQGTVCEMLENPGKEIYDVIRWFGMRKKIVNVHFRNLRGKHDSFCETYPDEGDVDMVRAMRVYKEVGYGRTIMPDHLPGHPDDPTQREGFAFAYGYIRALIQAVAAEG